MDLNPLFNGYAPRAIPSCREKNDSILLEYTNKIKFYKRTRGTAGKATYRY